MAEVHPRTQQKYRGGFRDGLQQFFEASCQSTSYVPPPLSIPLQLVFLKILHFLVELFFGILLQFQGLALQFFHLLLELLELRLALLLVFSFLIFLGRAQCRLGVRQHEAYQCD